MNGDRTINVVMRSRYEGNLTGELRKDQKRLDAFQRVLNRRPLMIPVKLDIRGAVAEARILRQEIQKELAKGAGAGAILGPGGTPARQSILGSAAGAGNLATTVTRRNGVTMTTTKDQTAPGITRSTYYSGSKQVGVTERDVTNVRRFQEALRDISRISAEYARAGARGDTSGQRRAIQQQIDMLGGQKGLLAQVSQSGLAGSPIFDRAENRLDRLRQTMARLEGRETTQAERSAHEQARRRFERMEKLHSRRIDGRLDRNDVALTNAKAIEDATQRQRELNRVLDDRRKILKDNQRFFQRLDAASTRRGHTDLGDKAFRRTLTAQNKLDQHDKEAAKLGIREQSKTRKEAAAEAKRDAAKMRADRQLELERMIQDEVNATRRRVKKVQAEERALKADAKTSRDRANIAGFSAEKRQRILQDSATRLAGMQGTADREGFGKTALKARAASQGAANSSIDQMNRFTAASKASGHALDFHSNKLLRNAATFAKWYGPMQMVLGTIQMFNAGLAGMTNIDRQFATLRAVFRGTAEEAQKLKEETVQLAVANGRSADEAMDAAVRFSRLGLTRVQVLKAVETALMAANVAEVDAAYAAEKLSAIYASYKLTIDDLPVVLNRLNAISNRYNVTNKDLLEGITRVAAVARNVGLELRDLEGLIGATVGATGRPGQEIGTSLRFVIQKTSRPETIQNLKDAFDFDMTKPTGELKSYLDILSELAELYPQLNSFEQSQLLDMTAGARQAAKFSEVLTNFNQAQALTIEAALDTNSAFAENQKIADSLSAQLQSLASEWTALWTAIGDTGAIDHVSQLLFDLREGVGGLTDFMRDRRPEGSFPITDRTTRSQVGVLMGDNSWLTGSPEKERNREQLLRARRIAEAIRDTNPENMLERTRGKAVMVDGEQVGSVRLTPGGNKVFDNGTLLPLRAKLEQFNDGEIDTLINGIDSLLGDQADTGLEAVRERAAAVPRFIESLKRLRRQLEHGDLDPAAAAKDYEGLAKAGRGLPGGTEIFSKTFTKTRSALSEGDNDAAMEGIDKLIENAEKHEAEISAAFEAARAERIAALESELAGAQEEQAKLVEQFVEVEQGSSAYDALNQKLEASNAKVKELSDSLQAARQDADDVPHQAIKSFARLERWFARMRGEHEMLNEFRTKILGGEDSPVSRRVGVARTGIRAPLETLRSARFKHVAAKTKLEDELGEGSNRELELQIKQHDEIISRFDTEIRKEEQAVRLAEKKAAAHERILRAQEAIDAGRQLASDLAISLGIGKDGTARDMNTFQGLMATGNRDMLAAPYFGGGKMESMTMLGQLLEYEGTMRGITQGMTTRRSEIGAELGNLPQERAERTAEIRRRRELGFARRRGSMKVRLSGIESSTGGSESERMSNELNAHLNAMGELNRSPLPSDSSGLAEQSQEYTDRRQRAEELIYSLMERQARLLREKKDLQSGITDEQKKQTDEISKRLLLASREDQLRAAALSRTIQDGGALSMGEFFYLSQESRQVAMNYFPKRGAGSGADPTESAKIDAELATLGRVLPGLRKTLEELGKGLPERFDQDLQDLNDELGRRRKELTDELGRISESLPGFRKALGEFSDRLTKLTGRNGPLALPSRPLEGAPDLTKPQDAPVELRVDQVQVNIKLAQEFEAITQAVVGREMEAMEKRILQRVSSGRQPDTSGTNSAVE